MEKLTGEIVGDNVGDNVGKRIVGLRVGCEEWIHGYQLATQMRDKQISIEVNVVLTLSVG